MIKMRGSVIEPDGLLIEPLDKIIFSGGSIVLRGVLIEKSITLPYNFRIIFFRFRSFTFIFHFLALSKNKRNEKKL